MTVADALAALREEWGDRWEIWLVPLALGGERWCARRHGDDLPNVLRADRPDHLAEYIADVEGKPTGGG